MILHCPSPRGEFRVEVLSPEGIIKYDSGVRPNLFLDAGLAQMAAGGNSSLHIAVGTGNTPPAVTDTALVNQVMITASPVYRQNIVYSAGAETVRQRYFHSFPAATVARNLTEIGLRTISGNTFLTRALFTDGGGSPVVISLAVGDVLRITYDIIVQLPLTDIVIPGQVNGVAHNFTLRPVRLGFFAASGPWSDLLSPRSQDSSGISLTGIVGGLVARTADPTGAAGAVSFGNKIPTSPTATSASASWAVAPGTGTGTWGSFFISGSAFAWQLAPDTPIVKTANDRMNFTFDYSWGRP